MRSVYLIRSGYQVETRYDYLSVPHDRFARLIQTSVATVTIRTLSNALNLSIFILSLIHI